MEAAEEEKFDEESELLHYIQEEPIIEEHHSESHSEVEVERHSNKHSEAEIEGESEHVEAQPVPEPNYVG